VNHNKFVTNLLIAILLVSCASPAVTNTPTPPKVLPTVISTASPRPTSTANFSLTQVEGTKVADLLLPYQRWPSDDLSALRQTLGESIIKTLWYTQNAKWWSSEDMQTAQEILNLGMNPGLGIRALHQAGIIGQGVTIAIIDQPVIPKHPEFEGKIIKYRDFGTGEFSDEGTMHGSAVMSLSVGKNIGTAPGAKVYFAAVPGWFYDSQYDADALDWIITENEKLPEKEKIRVVSVSGDPSGRWSKHKNQEAWDKAYQRAIRAGILVLDCTFERGYTFPCTLDLHDPDNITKCIPEKIAPADSPHERIYIPMSQRSTATEQRLDPIFSYQYVGHGGISWTVPYLAGVLALGWQINPKLTSTRLLDMVYASAYVTDTGQRVINPKAFIEMVKQTLN
jgi:serine protease AprX